MLTKKNIIFFLQLLLLCLAYFFTAKFGLSIRALNRFATIIWAPSGIAVAAVLLLGRRFWPAIFLGAFLVNFYTGAQVPVALGIATGNTLESILAAFFCFQLIGFQTSLDRRRDVIRFIIFAAILSPMVSAIIGVTSLFLGGQLPVDQMWITGFQWWTGDCIGILTITPLFLVFRRPVWKKMSWARSAEAAFLAVLMVSFVACVFMEIFSPTITHHLRGPILFPFLLWASMRFGLRGGVLATFVCAAVGLWATSLGLGPFVYGSKQEQLTQVSIFVIVLSMVDLMVASFVAELVHSEQELSKALRARDLFFSMASHELKTPLTSLKLQFQILEKDLLEGNTPTVPANKLGKIISASLRQVNSLKHLVDDLLDVSRLRMGHFDLRLEEVVLSEVIEEIVGRFSEPLARAKCEVWLGDVEDVAGLWDRRRLEQVLVNLISNAIKYAPRSQIKIQALRQKEDAVLVVEDSGPGIDESQHQRIFERFERLDEINAEGLGLGLYIVKEIVDAHHGAIHLRSSKDHGARFEIVLPVRPQMGKSPSSTRPHSGQRPGKNVESSPSLIL